jgi:hypothetical protein
MPFTVPRKTAAGSVGSVKIPRGMAPAGGVQIVRHESPPSVDLRTRLSRSGTREEETA